MRDEDLRSRADYNEGMRDAAHRVLIELVNILSEYKDHLMIIGGWVPDLLMPGKEHIGSVDVDILLDHEALQDASYVTIKRILERNEYRRHPEKHFTFVKAVTISEITYDIDVDFLAGKYSGRINGRSQKVQGVSALKATGGKFAFEVSSIEVILSAKRVDGAIDVGRIKVVSIVPFFAMKAAALGRGKAKDAYDIYFCIKNYDGGVEALAELFKPYRDRGLIKDMLIKLKDKFASPDHAGPADIVAFEGSDDEEENDILRVDAFGQVDMLIKLIEG